MIKEEKPVKEKVRVYGIRCETEDIECGDMINYVKYDLSQAKDGDTIRMVSGVADCNLYNKTSRFFKQYFEEKNLKYEMIAGPIISGCPNSDLLDLAEKGIINFYLSPLRRRLHYKIVDQHILRGEIPHNPLASKRLGYEIDVGKFDENNKKSAIFAIKRKIKEFEALKMFSDHIYRDDIKKRVKIIPRDQIIAVSKELKARGLNFDLLTEDQIIKVHKETCSAIYRDKEADG